MAATGNASQWDTKVDSEQMGKDSEREQKIWKGKNSEREKNNQSGLIPRALGPWSTKTFFDCLK